MTIKEIFVLVQANEDKFIGKPMGDAWHIIIGFEVLKEQGENYVVNLIAQNDRSGTPIVKQPVQEWLKRNKIDF